MPPFQPALAIDIRRISRSTCKETSGATFLYTFPEFRGSDGDQCIEENTPTIAEMRQDLDILKRGVQHRSTNFEKQYEYEQYK
ncbi:hypothetical protein AVEN_267897-1 [Araneus ventricosus]|uniref:Uncharacterized protein n=1 Tax=Araneus ventricosus TaxID=182803 RepID=A0A4Y2JJS6_ARAVE|nr:hypothetical protein AVEN_267897-1 [Araneus ventricosus]